MNSILLKKILTPTICFLIFFAICPEKSFAQKQYSISGKISVEDGDIENTYFTVYKNAKKLSTEAIALNGRLTYKLDFGNDYLFEFFKDGFVTKKLSISTFVPERILKKDSYFPPFKFQISLFPAYEGLDLSVFDQPMGIVMYDKRLDDFDYDKEYDAQIKDAIKKAEEEARRLAELKALNEKYAKAIEIADGHLKNKDYEISIRSYKQALKIKPKEQYPRDQIIKIENLLAEARKLAALQKLNESYEKAIQLADSHLENQRYDSAISSYREASSLKPEEQYPKNQIIKIENLLAEQKRQADAEARRLAGLNQLNESYEKAIQLADSHLENQRYDSAISSYREASSLKPEEQYPKNQIIKIENLLAEQKRQADAEARKLAALQKLNESYEKAIQLADSHLENQRYDSAISSYREASSLKPEEQYPKNQIIKIENLLAEQKHQADAEARRLASLNQLNESYEKAIQLADSHLENQRYDSAISSYREASSLKPEEQYPKNQIIKIENLLAEQKRQADAEARRLAGLNQLNESYEKAIQLADSHLENQRYDSAISSYREASSLKPEEHYPKNQIIKIENLLAEQKRQADAEARRLAGLRKRERANKSQDAEYLEQLKLADQFFKQEEYGVAKHYYHKAKEIKPNESYPKQQLKEIVRKIEERKALKLQEEYQESIAEADQALSKEELSVARFYYRKALHIKANEQYPKRQLEQIRSQIKKKKD